MLTQKEKLELLKKQQDPNYQFNEAVSKFIEKIPQIKGEKGDKGDTGEKGDSIIGPMGPQGPQGEKGDKGEQGIQGERGQRGESIIGPKGKDGLNGKDGKNGSPDSANDIVTKLNTLEEMLDISVIKNYRQYQESVKKDFQKISNDFRNLLLKNQIHGGGATSFTQLKDVPNSYVGQSLKGVRVNTAGTGLEFYTISSGGTPAGSNGDIQYNNAGAFGGVTFVPLGNGGFGESMVTQAVSSATSNALTPGLIRLTGSNQVINGITAGVNGQKCYVYAPSGYTGAVVVTNQNSSASAANRIVTRTGGSIIVQASQLMEFIYSTTLSRWEFVGLSANISSATIPLVISNSGVLTINQSNNVTNGYLSATDWTIFNNKIGGVASQYAIAYGNSNTTLTYDGYLNYEPSLIRLAVGLLHGNAEATGHFKSNVAQTIPSISAGSATLTAEVQPDTPIIGSIVEIYAATDTANLVATQQDGSGGRTADGTNSIQYWVYPYVKTSGGKYVINTTLSPITFGDNNDGQPFTVLLTWDASSIADGYIIQRIENSITYTIDVGNVGAYVDNQFADSGLDLSNTNANVGLFTANGTSYAFTSYGVSNSPITFYSASPDTNGATDDSTSNQFFWVVTVSGATGDGGKIICNTPTGTAKLFPASQTEIIFGSVNWTDSTTTTPNHIGFLSDGSSLNLSYDLYGYDIVQGVYSPTPQTVTTTDPNDGNYYTVTVTGNPPAPATYFKAIKNGQGKLVNGGSFVDYNGLNFTDSTTVTPNIKYAGAGLWESHGASTSDTAGMISRSLDGSYSRIEFQDNTKTPMGYIEQSSSGLRFQGKGGGYLFSNEGTNALTLSGTTINLQGTNTNIFGTNTNVDTLTTGTLTRNGSQRFIWNNIGIGFFAGSAIGQYSGDIASGLVAYGLFSSATLTTTSITNGQALTKTDDTNVTLTLGGTPSTALLKATSITVGWTGTLGVSRGGTGASSLNAAGIVTNVATADLTAQSAAKTTTAIYTPPATGLYRISVYLQVTTPASTSSVLGGATGVVITYNDGDGNVAQTDTVALTTTAGAIAISSATNTTATNLAGTLVVYAKTGVAINYAIGYTSVGVTAMQYAAHLKVERL